MDKGEKTIEERGVSKEKSNDDKNDDDKEDEEQNRNDKGKPISNATKGEYQNLTSKRTKSLGMFG